MYLIFFFFFFFEGFFLSSPENGDIYTCNLLWKVGFVWFEKCSWCWPLIFGEQYHFGSKNRYPSHRDSQWSFGFGLAEFTLQSGATWCQKVWNIERRQAAEKYWNGYASSLTIFVIVIKKIKFLSIIFFTTCRQWLLSVEECLDCRLPTI